jgi:hypothetical protein
MESNVEPNVLGARVKVKFHFPLQLQFERYFAPINIQRVDIEMNAETRRKSPCETAVIHV